MKQIYHPYYIWEDFKNGMYEIPVKPYSEILIKNCIELLSNQELFFEVSLKVLNNWKYASEHNLSNKSINRQAWIGQASCCLEYKAQEIVTREVWGRLDTITRIYANKTADKIIRIYEEKNNKLYKSMEENGLF